MGASFSGNVFFSFVLVVFNYAFPFVVYPYISRVLGPENLGLCDFVDSIVTYISMLSMMGASIAGVRAISSNRKDKEKLKQIATAIFILSGAFTILASILLGLSFCILPGLEKGKELMLMSQLKLWGNFLLLEWLFIGLEEFRYITIRSIAVKCIYALGIFMMVKEEGDYRIYYFLFCLTVALNSLLNCLKAFKLINFSYSATVLKQLAAPFVRTGFYLLLNGIYLTFPVFLLGLQCSTGQVGYFSFSSRIFYIALAFLGAYSSVVFPRASFLWEKRYSSEFRNMIETSAKVVLMYSVPIAFFGVSFSEGIAISIGGEQYAEATPMLMIVMPLVFIIGYEQILVQQILMPLHEDRILLRSATVGALVGISMNLLLVPFLQAKGTAIAWVCAEVAVLCLSQHAVEKRLGLVFPWHHLFKNVLCYLPYICLALFILQLPQISPIHKMMLGGACLLGYFYFVQRYVLRNPLFNGIRYRIRLFFKLERA